MVVPELFRNVKVRCATPLPRLTMAIPVLISTVPAPACPGRVTRVR